MNDPFTPQQMDRTLQKRLERLYVFWLVSFFLLLALTVIVSLAARGVLIQQQRRIAELEGRVQVLETGIDSSLKVPADVANETSEE
ncbi:MAG: hypothetical protein AB7N71_00825 [Phycisphaerae bacterium]